MGTELVSGTQIGSDAGSRSTSTESTSFALGGYETGYGPGIGRNTSVLPVPTPVSNGSDGTSIPISFSIYF